LGLEAKLFKKILKRGYLFVFFPLSIKSKVMDDQKIVELLRFKNQDKMFLKLYKNYPIIEKLICSKGGSKEDAKDIFQNALVIFYNNACQSNFKLTSSINTYLYSVCRFLWKDELLKKNKISSQEIADDFSIDFENDMNVILEKEAKFIQVEKVLQELGEKCLQVLSLFYYNGLSLKIIAQKMGLQSEAAAKTQKYKCLEQAKFKIKAL